MPEYNAKRIVKIYKGDTQVWADDMNWTDIPLNGVGRNAQYIVLPGNFIAFKGDVTWAELKAHGTRILTIPAKFKNLAYVSLGGSKMYTSSDSYWVTVKIETDLVSLTPNGNDAANPVLHLSGLTLSFTN